MKKIKEEKKSAKRLKHSLIILSGCKKTVNFPAHSVVSPDFHYNEAMSSRKHKFHRLELYRLAVQNPQIEVQFFQEAYLHYRNDKKSKLLREDFCGTAAVSLAWVQENPSHKAYAVDKDFSTLNYGRNYCKKQLSYREKKRLHFYHDLVQDVKTPKVDIIVAQNFSCFEFHKRKQLLKYFKTVLSSLKDDGLFIMDAYGGPGAMKVCTQRMEIKPDATEGIENFDYFWEQKSYDVLSARTKCSIHFLLDDEARMNDAFVYDWRLWTIPELKECLLEAGFGKVEIWCDPYDEEKGYSTGIYEPIKKMPQREDWVVYIIGISL
ncbi:hypothetical protein ACFL35_01720 [Candidatus Riflebacteria bacterium]